MIEVNPSLLCNHMTENVDLYIYNRSYKFSLSNDIKHTVRKCCMVESLNIK